MAGLLFDGSQNGTPVGYYTYLVGDDRWSWSDGVFELHGYEPHSVPATTELMLQHKHPDDTARAFEVLETAIRDGRPFSCYHRIVDAKKRVRSVLSVGRGVEGDDGRVEKVTGFFVDLTELRRSETQAEVDAALVRIAETRSVIDQAKGMVMVATDCSADEAFAVLRRYSSHKNLKVHDLAQRLVDAAAAGLLSGGNASGQAVTTFLEGLEPYSQRTAS